MLEKLKEYKEIITIIVFFLGGFIWLYTQFPSKSDFNAEMASLKCLLEKYMTLTQLQIGAQELEKQIQSLAKKVSEAQPDDPSGKALALSPAMKLEFEQLKSDLVGRRTELRSNTTEMEKIRNELGRQVCGKVNK